MVSLDFTGISVLTCFPPLMVEKMKLLITQSLICYNHDFSLSELHFLLSNSGIFSLGVSLIPFYGINISFMAVIMLLGSKQLHLLHKNTLITAGKLQ